MSKTLIYFSFSLLFFIV